MYKMIALTYIMFVVILIVGEFDHAVGALQCNETKRFIFHTRTYFITATHFIQRGFNVKPAFCGSAHIKTTELIPRGFSLRADGSIILTECFEGSIVSIQKQNFLFFGSTERLLPHTHTAPGCVCLPS